MTEHNINARAEKLKALHEAPEILSVVNVWDAISASTVASVPETKAIATAGHSIAAAYGYADGTMPLDVALEGVKRIVSAVELPVTADLDDGYEDPAETIRRAIGIGVVGANVEDRLRPFNEAVARVKAIVDAAKGEGIPFQLNARTDAIAKGGDRPIKDSVEDAIARGRAFLDAGAALVFVPGALTRDVIEPLVAGLGHGKLSVIGAPGALPAAELQELGVARVSYGPFPQRVALRALQDLAADLYGSGVIPKDTPALN
ncbi:isocitrate lyase/phosphoenolpyruvate mutase family protein [Paenarthrobacter ureafaciens]|jgi:2-methylisocitrate lyase-like PEP mutase family enzyme|uniref:isocitrate lyase/PEP mutase family protein n=1 Tax=Paenarthrobacter TaxID=1742992 RepID=UPI00074D46C9|nr:isocitrate lyase/phosphoenolpyruvate mutase family protein [Paenarthrobacter ureafaciens]AMB40304.1 phosphonomutase [Arthrobacter sp. ATCC 21022]KUR63509.1 phosphonomutase [Arthrobacter sp. ATCC 21022]MCX8453551.1 isocitrate lyase/phosphoenolpyruvate mutase family protein [Paenarthrobacter ureafaciens]MCY0973210.1 isocitrate lyase/phosphoenolpyruvate mutase family protein [Paenarthrobacter ureafaciens]NWL27181.1 isocitrate lyase/phosphoenolpyruvate mutase family protein [Paenarthrobacter ur